MSAELSPGVVVASRIAAGDDRTRYDGLSIALHWTTAGLVIAQFGLGELWGFVSKPDRGLMIKTHMTFGILLAAVLAVRIVWRWMPRHQVTMTQPKWIERAAKSVHYLLYLLLAVEVVLGFTWPWSGQKPLIFFGLPIPSPLPLFPRPEHILVAKFHNWVAWTIIILAGGHAAAALLHHTVMKDDVLKRMLPHGQVKHGQVKQVS